MSCNYYNKIIPVYCFCSAVDTRLTSDVCTHYLVDLGL